MSPPEPAISATTGGLVKAVGGALELTEPSDAQRAPVTQDLVPRGSVVLVGSAGALIGGGGAARG